MKLEDLRPKPIKLVSGKICSGKGTYCSNLPGYNHIATSDVVKEISGFNKRSDLHTTQDLDQQIADRLIELIKEKAPIVIDGIRQKSIMQRIIDEFGIDKVDLVWLEVPEEELKRRFDSRSDKKDDLDFQVALQRDHNLGLGEVEEFIKTHAAGTKLNNM